MPVAVVVLEKEESCSTEEEEEEKEDEEEEEDVDCGGINDSEDASGKCRVLESKETDTSPPPALDAAVDIDIDVVCLTSFASFAPVFPFVRPEDISAAKTETDAAAAAAARSASALASIVEATVLAACATSLATASSSCAASVGRGTG